MRPRMGRGEDDNDDDDDVEEEDEEEEDEEDEQEKELALLKAATAGKNPAQCATKIIEVRLSNQSNPHSFTMYSLPPVSPFFRSHCTNFRASSWIALVWVLLRASLVSKVVNPGNSRTTTA